VGWKQSNPTNHKRKDDNARVHAHIRSFSRTKAVYPSHLSPTPHKYVHAKPAPSLFCVATFFSPHAFGTSYKSLRTLNEGGD